MPRRFAAVVFLAIVIAVPWRHAGALETQALRDAIVAGLEGSAGPLSGGVPLSYDEVRVWPHGGGHRVEIAGLATEPGEHGQWASIGDLAFTVEDAGQGFYRVADLATAESASIHGADGSQVGLLTYRLQRFEGLWHGALGSFLDLDLLATDLRFGLTDGSFIMALAQLGAVSRSEQLPDGRYSQDARGRLTGLRAEAAGHGVVELREATGESTTSSFDLAAYAALSQELEALGAAPGEPNEAEVAALLQRMAGLNLFPKSFDQRFQVSDLAAVDAGGQSLFRLDTLEWTTGASALDQPLAEARFGAQHRGLQPGPAAAAHLGVWRDLVPSESGLVLALEGLPAVTLWQAVLRTMAFAALQPSEPEGGTPPPGDMAMFMLMAEVMPALIQAGTRLRVPRFHIEAPAAQLDAEGQFDMDGTAAQGVSGWLNIALRGLDRIMELLQQEAAAGDTSAQSALGFAIWLKGLARRESDPEGRPVDRYELRLTPDGQVLVNGAPFGMPQ